MSTEQQESHHVKMTVAAAMGMNDGQLTTMFDGTAIEIRAELERLKGIGRIYLLTAGCDNYDELTGECLSHYTV